MITKFPIEDRCLITDLNERYSIEIDRLAFIPMGDSAYSYRVDCVNGQTYYLKLFDHQNERQLTAVTRLSYSLPLTWQLYHGDIFKNITYPIKNDKGSYKTSFDGYTTVLFNFIEGETLANAYPFSDDILKKVAKTVAIIQLITPKIDVTSLPKETLDISFAPSLKKCMKELEHPAEISSPVVLALRQLVLANKELIDTALNELTELLATCSQDARELVLCHGDIWGGNMICHGQDLYVIDWESVIVAPPEYNLCGYLGDGFEVFFTEYEKQLNQPVSLNLDLLRFFSYRTHLRNLTNWLTSILYGNNSSAQDHNDLDMIRDHCLNRFASVGPNVLGVEALLEKRSGRGSLFH